MSLLSLQVSHNMYQIQSVYNGHFFPSPQPRHVFAKLTGLALARVSGNGAHLRTDYRFPRGTPPPMELPRCSVATESTNMDSEVQRNAVLCPIRNNLISLEGGDEMTLVSFRS